MLHRNICHLMNYKSCLAILIHIPTYETHPYFLEILVHGSTFVIPYSLSTITFDATDTDIEYFTADVSFKYTIYTITDLENKPLT